MADPSLTLLIPMETMVPQLPSAIVQYRTTLDLRTSIIFCFTIIIFFVFLFHMLSGFIQWFFDVRTGNPDLELGEASIYHAAAQSNIWVVGVLERLVSSFEERRLWRMRVLERLPPAVKFGGGEKKGEECAICLEELVKGEVCQVLPACNHIFHSDCIAVWLTRKSTCPVCRRNCILDA